MPTTIITKFGSGAPTTSDVVEGELAVDTTNGRLYTQDGSSVIEIGLNPSGNVDVTGTVTADGLTVNGIGSFSSTAPYIDLFETDTTDVNSRIVSNSSSLRLQTVGDDGTGATNRLLIDHTTGDISFYEDTGNTAKLFWDASAEALWLQGYGTSTTPAGAPNAINDAGLYFANNGGNARWALLPEESAGEDTLNLFADVSDAWQPVISFSRTTQNVGIGTASPPTKLTVFGSGVGNATVQIEGESGADPYINFLANNTQHWSLGVDDSDSDKFKLSEHSALGTNDYFVVDTVGNVGIGTSSPAYKLDISGTAGTNSISLTRSTSATNNNDSFGNFYWTNSSGNNVASIAAARQSATDDAYLTFNTRTASGSNTERMRIDSSGNLLVGKTANDNTTAGHRFTASGFTAHVVSNDYPLLLNRLSSDGALLTFRKDSTTVGSIASTDGTDLQIGSGNCYLRFDDATNQILPTNAAGTKRNGALDLGDSDAQFKDLYLSGGAFIGGTGAANKLDDYEEGTFTATYLASTSNPTVVFAVNACSYVKVGNLCTVQIRVRTSSITSQGSGELRIGGLPFAASDAVTALYSAASIGYAVQWDADNTPAGGYITVSQSFITLIKYASDDPRDALNVGVDAASLNTGANGNHVILEMTYRTT